MKNEILIIVECIINELMESFLFPFSAAQVGNPKALIA
jgi:hypothetical protein